VSALRIDRSIQASLRFKAVRYGATIAAATRVAA
jgi:hypothetical protein